MRDIEMDAVLTHPHYADGRSGVRLELTDRASRYLIASVEFTPEQFVSFVGSTSTRVLGQVLSREVIGRIGARMEHKSEVIRYGHELIAGHYDAGFPPGLTEHAERNRAEGGWDDAAVRRTNFGYEIDYRRYVHDE